MSVASVAVVPSGKGMRKATRSKPTEAQAKLRRLSEAQKKRRTAGTTTTTVCAQENREWERKNEVFIHKKEKKRCPNQLPVCGCFLFSSTKETFSTILQIENEETTEGKGQDGIVCASFFFPYSLCVCEFI
ncbi:hypothetical protein B9Z55_024710 [Caenorhabditis nigoni]|uniref:Uncharacterized protein n=1 Tax=Caenorhabditis nigoni TaxID=1611254 RepID=A0A2G5SV70_9PELO|nr:hypothetical protein B9Z55_024710 [Caenorhabditis nigoni]